MDAIVRESFGVTKRGEPVARFTLTNRRGSSARLISYGATLSELCVPDRAGKLGDVVLGFDNLERYEQGSPYIGCTIGRVANRIANASFDLDGEEFRLAANEGGHHLHGGSQGFDKVVWKAAEVETPEGPALRFSHVSPSGDEGYPGELDVSVTYRLGHDDSLGIEYSAVTTAPTPVNLTNHSYWNLSGVGSILDHTLQLQAGHYTEVDSSLIPTGRTLPVEGSELDFTRAKAIGRDLASLAQGYDHNLVLVGAKRSTPVAAGELYDPKTGRVMTFSTTEPGVQLYTGNSLDGIEAKRGEVHHRHGAVCLEAQGFPDAIHRPEFPSIVLRPGETYRQTTGYGFSAR